MTDLLPVLRFLQPLSSKPLNYASGTEVLISKLGFGIQWLTKVSGKYNASSLPRSPPVNPLKGYSGCHMFQLPTRLLLSGN